MMIASLIILAFIFLILDIQAFSTYSHYKEIIVPSQKKNDHHVPPIRRTPSIPLFSTAQQKSAAADVRNNSSSSAPIQLSMIEYTTSSSSDSTTHPPILFLHGLLGSKRNFNSLATTLSNLLVDQNRQIVGMDLRNHGESPVGEIMSYDIMAQDVIHTLDQNNLDKIVVIGHSMGGKVAAALALLYPERIEGLVVLDMAPAVYDGDCAAWSAVRDIVQNLATQVDMDSCQTKRDVDLQLRSILPDPALRAFVLTNVNTSSKDSIDWSIPMSTLHQQLSTLAGFLEDDALEEYQGDAYFIAGGQSKFIRHVHLDPIQKYFPNHMITTIRGAGHWLHAEAPDNVLALLVKYLDR